MSTLTSLNLSYCDNITDVGLVYLENMTSLTRLNLGSCRNTTDVGRKKLTQQLPNLTIIPRRA